MIVLNGDVRQEGAGAPVSELLRRLGLGEEAHGVAVAVDGQVVPRAQWRDFQICDGARVEVLSAMQGG